jgi:hypothetical protein
MLIMGSTPRAQPDFLLHEEGFGCAFLLKKKELYRCHVLLFEVAWICIMMLTYGCSALQGIGKNESSPQSPVQQTTEQAIPASSPLSKINKGMGTKEVADVLGQPSDREMLLTGKRSRQS